MHETESQRVTPRIATTRFCGVYEMRISPLSAERLDPVGLGSLHITSQTGFVRLCHRRQHDIDGRVHVPPPRPRDPWPARWIPVGYNLEVTAHLAFASAA